MRYWSLLKEKEFLEFIGEYFVLYENKYHRGRFSGWESEYTLKNSDLILSVKIDEDEYVTEFYLYTWERGFSNMGQSIHIRKNTDKTVYQSERRNSFGRETWGVPKSMEKNYTDYIKIYDELHIFIMDLYPNVGVRQQRDKILKSLLD